MRETATDKTAQPFRQRLAGQVLGLFLWPLLTVMLVVGALYLDRINNFSELTVHKEALLVRAVSLLFEATGQTVAADLQRLFDHPAFQPALSEVSDGRESALVGLFNELLATRRFYIQVRLLDARGQVLVQVPDASIKNTEPPVDDVAAALLRPAGTLLCLPSTILLSRGITDNHANHLVRFAVPLIRAGEGADTVLTISCRLSELLELVQEIGAGQRGFLVIASHPARVDDLVRVMPVATLTNQAEVAQQLKKSGQGYFFQDGSLYTYSTSVSMPQLSLSPGGPGREAAMVEPWLVAATLPAAFFTEQQHRYLLFLAVVALALLIPSLVVCLFWAKARIRARQEADLRALEQVEHLVGLEQQVRERTRELDDRNLQLSAEIAERLNAESKLRQSNELLAGMVESIDGVIYVSDFNTHEILFANTYLKKLFGFDPIGKKCWHFIHASSDGPCHFCVNHRLLDDQGEPTGPYQWEYQNPFNKKWYRAKDQAIRWSNGNYVKLEIAIDITEQKQLQHFLQEARKQAEIARNMRSRFVALVAHDLKSPFYSITQMLKRILERETFSSEVHRQFLENIVTNGYRMLQMIDDLLSMDRFESAEVKLARTFFNVTEMTKEVIDNFRHLAEEKSLRVVNSLPDDCLVYADKYLYFVVLNNLVSNAIKFSEAGGTIEVLQPDPQRPMTISVRDEGQGMSPEYLKNIFKLDVKTSCKGTKGEPGSGLGLLFCQDILKAHGGTLTVESEVGQGSVFSIVLPECCACRCAGQEEGGGKVSTSLPG